MASTIILSDNGASSGSAGLKQTAGNDGVLILQTTTSGGTATNAIYVDTSQNVGIGSSSPGGYKLAIGDGSSNRGRIMLKGATGGNYPEINIDDTMNTSGKNYQMYSTGGVLKVSNQTDATVSFVANNYGIGLGDNSAVDGTGIRFPASQNASSNVNTLDDYEEGTFTPTAYGQSSAGTTTYSSTPSGVYTKIGNVCYFKLTVAWSNMTGTGNLLIGGMPFTANSSSPWGNTMVHANNLTFSGQLDCLVAASGNSLYPYTISSNASGTQVGVDTSAAIEITGFYFTS